ncbi:hypothetical protein Tco_1407258 [Tanacetum coccineum]
MLQQQQKPQKSVADIRKIKIEMQENSKRPNTPSLYLSILEDEDAMDKGVADKSKKRKPDDADRDESPPTGSNQGLKRKKIKETLFVAGDTQVPQNLGEDIGNSDEPPIVNVDPKDWFKKPERPPTPDPEWNDCKIVDNKSTHKWLSDLAKAEQPSKTLNDLMRTSIDFNAFAMNRLQISDLT